MKEILQDEKKYLGLYISGHPLKQYEEELALFAGDLARDLIEKDELGRVRVAGIITEVKKKKTKSGDRMAILLLEDLTGVVDVAIMPNLLEEREALLQEEAILIVDGQASHRGDQVSVRADRIYTLDEAWALYVRSLHITFSATELDEEMIYRLKGCLLSAMGESPVFMHVAVPEGGVEDYELEASYKVRPSRELKLRLEDLFQNAQVSFKLGNPPAAAGGGTNGRNYNGRGNGARKPNGPPARFKKS